MRFQFIWLFTYYLTQNNKKASLANVTTIIIAYNISTGIHNMTADFSIIHKVH